MGSDHEHNAKLPNASPALELPILTALGFQQLVDQLIDTTNLGSGLDISGTSGSGKTNCVQWTILRTARKRVPFIYIDPHGDGARKAWRMCSQLPDKLRENIVYWRVADGKNVASINPLAHPGNDTEASH